MMNLVSPKEGDGFGVVGLRLVVIAVCLLVAFDHIEVFANPEDVAQRPDHHVEFGWTDLQQPFFRIGQKAVTLEQADDIAMRLPFEKVVEIVPIGAETCHRQ